MKTRLQPLVVIRDKNTDLFWTQSTNTREPRWTDDLYLANVINPLKVRSMIKIDWGRDIESYEILKIVPKLVEE